MIGQLIEDLCIANIKLYMVCQKKFEANANPGGFTKKKLLAIMEQDINLCRRRAQLKSAIDQAINRSIIEGEVNTVEEVKRYGLDS